MSELSPDLEGHLQQMLHLAQREGMEPGTPLGQWVEAVRVLTVAVDAKLARVAADARTAAQASSAAASAAERRTEAALQILQIRTEQVQAQVIETLAPAVAEAVGKAVVIRERRHNRTIGARWAVGITAFLLALFVGGWTWRGHVDAPALEFQAYCQRALVRNGAGQAFCPVDVPLGLPTRSANRQR